MSDYPDRIKELEDEIKNTQYNKATQHHVGLIKAKIAILRGRAEAAKTKKGAAHGFSVRKSGEATVCMVGFPSVGKSTLLNALTNAESRIAAYAFTTLTCIPGILEYKSARIQILDVPGLISGASAGAGKGKEVLSVIRNADMVILIADIFDLKQLETIRSELYKSDIRIDEEKPGVTIKQSAIGKLQIFIPKKLTSTSPETIKAILREYRVNSGTVTIKEDITAERLIDALEGNRVYMPSIIVLNKADMVSNKEAEKAAKLTGGMPLSAENRTNMEELKDAIYRTLRFIRVYLKERGKKVDSEPLIMRQGSTIADVCRKLHREFVSKFRYARVWGKSAKHPGERFMLDHALQDNDSVEIKVR